MYKTSRLSTLFLFLFALFLTLLLCLPGVSGKEPPKPKPQDWQINGILAALDDSYPKVKEYAFKQLAKYEPQDLKAVLKKPEDIAQKAANILKDEKVDSDVRSSAAEALGNLGEAGAKYAPDLFNILKDEKVDLYVRSRAAGALGNLGEAGAKYAPDLFNILKDEEVDSTVRYIAANALGNLGEAGANYAPALLNIFKDEKVDLYVRSRAAAALGNLGEAGAKYAPDLANFLKDEKVDSNVRSGAAAALGNLGEAGAKYAPDLLNFLQDEKVELYVRISAAAALGNLGEAGAKYAPDLANILKDEKVDLYVRSSAAAALGNLGEAGAKYAPDLANFLKDEKVDSNVRSGAAEALGNLGEAGAKYAPDLLNILQDEKVDLYVRSNAAQALGNIRKLALNEVLVVLNNLYEPNQQNTDFETWRFFTYFLSGGTDEIKTLLTWLGNPQTIPEKLTYEEGKKTLTLFRDIWTPSQELKRLQKDLADKIAHVTRLVIWKPQDITLLQTHYHNLKTAKYNQADTIEYVINNLELWKWFFNARNTIIIHITFWLALIFAYPKSPQVQAIFFWNPWVRKILGIGYVGFLLTWVPFLRRKLFEPFKPSLLADAGLDQFDTQAYFPESKIKLPNSKEILPITQALPTIKGQIILCGDSGLGKSMFLRHVVKNSQQIIVYLPAQKCHQGVIEAIQAKLHGQAQDAEFLKNLIYSGAIDICIDGLNEVTADTRASITHFVEHYFQGNIIMTTQPLEWIPPSTAKTYHLQPLEQGQIQEFLISRKHKTESILKPTTANGQNTHTPNLPAYEQACINYLAEALNPQQPPEELAAAQRILSNPMDLTLVALMLSQGKQPNLLRLQQEQYNLMAAEYLQEWHKEFPLKQFSAAVYQMRLNDEKVLPVDGFYQVLMSLEDEKYKMVVSRQWKNEQGEDKKEWFFRHDKIMDFFLVQNFLGNSIEAEERLVEHIGDPRFRGVYFLLATFLPLEDAQELREKLIQYAADTKDHTVSDTFVQLLRTR